jgi:hypothetical protein
MYTLMVLCARLPPVLGARYYAYVRSCTNPSYEQIINAVRERSRLGGSIDSSNWRFSLDVLQTRRMEHLTRDRVCCSHSCNKHPQHYYSKGDYLQQS